jgi:hypothetical protein
MQPSVELKKAPPKYSGHWRVALPDDYTPCGNSYSMRTNKEL